MNFPKFPLYESLSNLKNEQDISEDDKKEMIEKINLMSTEKHEILYALIKAYNINEQYSSEELPYGGKIQKNSKLKFDLNSIPSKLQFILKSFCDKN